MQLMRRPLCLMRGCPSLPQGGEPFPARGIQPYPAMRAYRREALLPYRGLFLPHLPDTAQKGRQTGLPGPQRPL